MEGLPVWPVEGAAAVALNPRDRSSAAGAEEEEATQSAKAPESEGSLLVVATTAADGLIIQKIQLLFLFLSLSLLVSLSKS